MKQGIVALLAAVTLGMAGAQEPAAVVADGTQGGGRSGCKCFVVEAIDGQPVKTNAINASLAASRGRGADMRLTPAERTVPAARPVKLKLLATQVFAMPVQSIFRSMFGSGTPEARGEVEVTLAPDRRYRVAGAIDSFRREVWIEDDAGQQVAGSFVAMPPEPELLKAMEGAVFITANLRYDDDCVGSGTAPDLPFAPVGSRLKVLEWGKTKARVLIDGRKMRVALDGDESRETIQQFVARVTSAEDPRTHLAQWPLPTQQAVRAGRVLPGMTREQVLMALGPPHPDLTPSREAAQWAYELNDGSPLRLNFDAAGLLADVEAADAGRAAVLQPAAPTAAGAPAPAAASAPH